MTKGQFLLVATIISWVIVSLVVTATVLVIYGLIAGIHAVAVLFSVDPSIAIASAALAVFAVILVAICFGAVMEGRSQYEPVEVSDGDAE